MMCKLAYLCNVSILLEKTPTFKRDINNQGPELSANLQLCLWNEFAWIQQHPADLGRAQLLLQVAKPFPVTEPAQSTCLRSTGNLPLVAGCC